MKFRDFLEEELKDEEFRKIYEKTKLCMILFPKQ